MGQRAALGNTRGPDLESGTGDTGTWVKFTDRDSEWTSWCRIVGWDGKRGQTSRFGAGAGISGTCTEVSSQRAG